MSKIRETRGGERRVRALKCCFIFGYFVPQEQQVTGLFKFQQNYGHLPFASAKIFNVDFEDRTEMYCKRYFDY